LNLKTRQERPPVPPIGQEGEEQGKVGFHKQREEVELVTDS